MAKNFFDELSDTLTKTAQSFSTRVGGLYEAQKVTNKIGSEERMVKKLLADMGQVIYDRFASGEEIDSDLVEFCTQIKEHQDRIEVLKTESLRKKGQKVCPVCQKTVDTGYAFCPYCGAEVPTPEPVEEAEEQTGETTEEENQAAEEADKFAEEMNNAAQDAADAIEKAVEDFEEKVKDFINPEE